MAESAEMDGSVVWSRDCLRRHRVRFIDNMNDVTVRQVLDRLADRMLDEERERILCDGQVGVTTNDRIRNLLDTLPTKGQRTIDAFKRALWDCECRFLVNEIDQIERQRAK
ncbi:uncharacterized protein LOC144919209 [Branchiostoma floridae x Branchiostoma belcheri]|nr:hypothetical protein Bbelb_436600 [Branchiostoma belcheri]